MLLEKEYSVDPQKIAESFPLQTTVQDMLQIFQHLFGLVFVEITSDERDTLSVSGNGSDLIWHEDVKVFTI